MKLPLQKFIQAFAMLLLIITLTGSCKKDFDQPELSNAPNLQATPASTAIIPTITGISPNKGAVKTIITITGTNFSAKATDNVVKFNNTPAKTRAASKTQLQVAVPDHGTTGPITVKVKTNAVITGPVFTYVLPATLRSIAPASGKAGDTVTIIGTNFSTVPAENLVKFLDLPAIVVSAVATKLKVLVPAGAKTCNITLSVLNGAILKSLKFTVLKAVPTISSLNPSSGKIGDTIIINGTNFSTVKTQNTVKFNNIAADVTAATLTQIKAVVPVTAKTGKVTLSVLNNGAVNGPTFTVTKPAPTLTALNPATGNVGDTIIVTGTNFNNIIAQNLFKFAGTSENIATIAAARNTQFKVVVPAGAKTGKVTLSVSGGAAVTGPTFTVTRAAPTIRSVNYSFGKVGDTIVIAGTNFSIVKTDNVVKFGGAKATILAAKVNKLTVQVPAAAKTGNITLSVAGSAIITGPLFTIADIWHDMGFNTAIQKLNTSASAGNSLMFTGGLTSGYLYYSANGSSYTNVFNNLPFDKNQLLTINLIAADATTTGGATYYVTTNQGIAKTQNGSTWTLLHPGGNNDVYGGFKGIIAKNSKVFLLTFGALYASPDAGATWTTTYTTQQSGFGVDYMVSDGSNTNWYAVKVGNNILNDDPKRLYKSTDHGLLWAATEGITGIYSLNIGTRNMLCTLGSSIYSLYSPSTDVAADQRLYKSTNAGTSWTLVYSDPYNFVKTVGDYLLFGGNNLVVSKNGVDYKVYTLPAGYAAGGVERAGGYVYIFCYTKTGEFKSKIFRQKI